MARSKSTVRLETQPNWMLTGYSAPSSKVKKGDRITLRAGASNDSNSVYDLLDKIGKSIPLNLDNMTQV